MPKVDKSGFSSLIPSASPLLRARDPMRRTRINCLRLWEDDEASEAIDCGKQPHRADRDRQRSNLEPKRRLPSRTERMCALVRNCTSICTINCSSTCIHVAPTVLIHLYLDKRFSVFFYFNSRVTDRRKDGRTDGPLASKKESLIVCYGRSPACSEHLFQFGSEQTDQWSWDIKTLSPLLSCSRGEWGCEAGSVRASEIKHRGLEQWTWKWC